MSNITGSFYSTSSNLTNSIPFQQDVTDITQRITGITYDSIFDTTTIDNNVTITVPHVLTLNGINVYDTIYNNESNINSNTSRIVSLETATTGITYASTDDITTIDNNVVVSSSKSLTVSGQNVNTRFSNIEQQITGVSYNSGTDYTTIDNNCNITTGKALIVNGQDVNLRLNTLEYNMQGIAYDNVYDATNIANTFINLDGSITLNGPTNLYGNQMSNISNIYVNAGGNYYINGVPIVTGTAMLSSNNTWTGSNTYTNISVNQDFTNSNIKMATRSANDNNTYGASTLYVRNQINAFKGETITFSSKVTFSPQSPDVIYIPRSDVTYKVPNSEWIARNVDNHQAVGMGMLCDDFIFPLGSDKYDDVTWVSNGINYVFNTNGSGTMPILTNATPYSYLNHQGIWEMRTTGYNQYCALSHASWQMFAPNLAYYELVVRCSVSELGDDFINYYGVVDNPVTLTNGTYFKVDNGVWTCVHQGTTLYTFTPSGSPYVGEWLDLQIIFNGTPVTSVSFIWKNMTTNAVYTYNGNITMPDLLYTPVVHNRNDSVSNMNYRFQLDYMSVKYNCDRL